MRLSHKSKAIVRRQVDDITWAAQAVGRFDDFEPLIFLLKTTLEGDLQREWAKDFLSYIDRSHVFRTDGQLDPDMGFVQDEVRRKLDSAV